MPFNFKEISEKDFIEFKSWFEDKELNRQLGPMDEETWELWQSYRKREEPCVEICAFQEGDLVGVVNVKLASKTDPIHCILAIAIRPKLKGKGLGSELLRQLMRLEWFDESKAWMAHVDEENDAGLRFFEKNNWKRRPGKSNGMYTYEIGLESNN